MLKQDTYADKTKYTKEKMKRLLSDIECQTGYLKNYVNLVPEEDDCDHHALAVECHHRMELAYTALLSCCNVKRNEHAFYFIEEGK